MKRKRELLPAHELMAFFDQVDYAVPNKKKVNFEMHLPETIIATWRLENNIVKGYTLDLIADYSGLDKFIAENSLCDLAGMNLIDKSALWLNYLQGDGYVCCTIPALDLEVGFRLVNGITIVYSLDLHFYDEEYRVMSMTEQFNEYLEGVWDLFASKVAFMKEVVGAGVNG